MLVRCTGACLGMIILLKRRGRRHAEGGRGKLEQLLINMSALSCVFFSQTLFSVEEEEEDEEMMEAKPGPELEQRDEDESKETKEGLKSATAYSYIEARFIEQYLNGKYCGFYLRNTFCNQSKKFQRNCHIISRKTKHLCYQCYFPTAIS